MLSIRNVRDGPPSVLPASSVARTWTVYWPSAGKLAAPKASDQLPPASVAVWKVSPPDDERAPVPVEAGRDALDRDLDAVATPERASECVPQKPLVAQPAFQVAFV